MQCGNRQDSQTALLDLQLRHCTYLSEPQMQRLPPEITLYWLLKARRNHSLRIALRHVG